MVGVICAPPSQDNHMCHVKQTNYGDCSFAINSPVVWNTLLAELRLDMSLSVFWKRRKTFLMT